jgi:hypothetical protein
MVKGKAKSLGRRMWEWMYRSKIGLGLILLLRVGTIKLNIEN